MIDQRYFSHLMIKHAHKIKTTLNKILSITYKLTGPLREPCSDKRNSLNLTKLRSEKIFYLFFLTTSLPSN